MKNRTILVALVTLAAGWLLAQTASDTSPEGPFRNEEYATIRWDGRDNTHVVRPNGRTDSMRGLFSDLDRPRGADERVFYMNAAMNALAREGYIFAGLTEDTIVMRRSAK